MNDEDYVLNLKKLIKLIRKNAGLLNQISAFKTSATNIIEDMLSLKRCNPPDFNIHLCPISGEIMNIEVDCFIDKNEKLNDILGIFYKISSADAKLKFCDSNDLLLVLNPDYIYEDKLLDWADSVEKDCSLKFDYYSPEFRKLRYKVFLRDGEECAYCGAVPKPGTSLTIDHIKPVSKFPELALDIDNLQVLCWECNQKKSNKY